MDSELDVLGKVSHPNILEIHELLHDDKFYFIVSEFVKYGELYEFIIKQGAISEKQVKSIVR